MGNPLNITFPMRKGPQGAFATNDDTLSAISDDLRILLITNHGERPAQYDFGANLRSLVFKNFEGDSMTQAIKDRIQVAVDKWMPFVQIVNLDVSTSNTNKDVGSNEIRVSIEFKVGNIDATKILNQTIGV